MNAFCWTEQLAPRYIYMFTRMYAVVFVALKPHIVDRDTIVYCRSRLTRVHRHPTDLKTPADVCVCSASSFHEETRCSFLKIHVESVAIGWLFTRRFLSFEAWTVHYFCIIAWGYCGRLPTYKTTEMKVKSNIKLYYFKWLTFKIRALHTRVWRWDSSIRDDRSYIHKSKWNL